MARTERQILEAGGAAPDFRLARFDGGVDGSHISLEEIAARGPALLAFFKVSCPVCQLAFPFLERIHQAGTLKVYGISQNDAASTRSFAERFGTTFPMLLDSEKSGFPASNAYGISSVPTMFLVGTNRSIEQVIVGWRKPEMVALGAVRPDDKVPEWKAG